METQPNNADLDAALRQAAISAGMITIISFNLGANSIPVTHTTGTDFVEEIMRPRPDEP